MRFEFLKIISLDLRKRAPDKGLLLPCVSMKINSPSDEPKSGSSLEHHTDAHADEGSDTGPARDETAAPRAQEPAVATRGRGKVLRLRRADDAAAEPAAASTTRTVLRSGSSALPSPAPGRAAKLVRDFDDAWCKAHPPAPKGKRVVVWDGSAASETAELSFRVTDTGSKAWVIEKWVHGRSWKYTIGPFDPKRPREHLDVVKARRVARRALDELADGKDPREEARKRQEAEQLADTKKRGANTVGQLVQDFLARKDRHNAGETHRKEQRRQFETEILPVWKNVSVDEISASDVRALTAPIAKRAPFAANRCFATIRKFFTWALNEGHVKTHPAVGLEPPGGAETERKRWLTDRELKAVWDATGALGFPFSDVVRLAILTGQRRGEITGMRWSDLDFKARTWIIPRTKSNVTHVVPLAPAALRLLKEIAKDKRVDESDDGFVFCFHAGVRLSPWGHAITALRKTTGIEFRGHDLRKTVRTNLPRLGVASDDAERVIGHVIGGVRKSYDFWSYYPQKRDALERWDKHVAKILRAKS